MVEAQPGSTSFKQGFTIDYTPDVLIRLGIFGGLSIKGIENEIPMEWILFGLLDDKIINDEFPEQSKNFFEIIAEPYPLGNNTDSRHFFHWLCRYYWGKRCAEDISMINQWKEQLKLKNEVLSKPQHKNLISKQKLLQWGIFVK